MSNRWPRAQTTWGPRGRRVRMEGAGASCHSTLSTIQFSNQRGSSTRGNSRDGAQPQGHKCRHVDNTRIAQTMCNRQTTTQVWVLDTCGDGARGCMACTERSAKNRYIAFLQDPASPDVLVEAHRHCLDDHGGVALDGRLGRRANDLPPRLAALIRERTAGITTRERGCLWARKTQLDRFIPNGIR